MADETPDTKPATADTEPATADTEPATADTKPTTADTEPTTADAAAAKAKAGKPPAAKAKPAASTAAKPAKPAAKTPRAAAAKPARPGLRGRVGKRGRAAKASGGDRELPVVRAQAKYVRTSARKARLVCDHIRGKSVDEAEAILAFAPRAVAADWAKLLKSAVANAENNHELLGENLRVKEAFADEGPTLKRFRPRAMGRATPIRKRTSHLTITLTPKE
jgi:large subunit ribosomal protein L22